MIKSLLTATLLATTALFAWLAPPAEAFNFSGCGEFELIARDNIQFEATGTPKTVEGDILVAAIPGFIKIGTGWTFQGALFADTIIVGQGSTVAKCVANTILGGGSCLESLTPYVPFPGCTVQPFPPGIVIPQLPASPADCIPGTAIVVTSSQSLSPGCYASIRVGKNQTLTLDAGSFYLVRGEFRTLNGGDVVSNVPGSRATIAARSAVTESNVLWKDLFVFQLSAAVGALHIFNDSILDNTVVISPYKTIHIHTGSQLKGDSALAGTVLEVEPVSTVRDVPPPVVCACPEGYVFKVPVCSNLVSCGTARECVLDVD